METMSTKACERSVNSLQHIYSIVVGVSVTVILGNLVTLVQTVGVQNFASYRSELLMFISYIHLVIPFFHGGNRYLDATYVTREREAKTYCLLLDFAATLFQGLILFVMAVVASSIYAFYSVVVLLLIWSVGFVGLTFVTTTREYRARPHHRRWAVVNLLAIMAILVTLWSDPLLGFSLVSGVAQEIVLAGIVFVRTVLDYLLVWSFYYPAMDTPGK